MYNDQLYNSRVYKCAWTTHFYVHNSMYAHAQDRACLCMYVHELWATFDAYTFIFSYVYIHT